MADVKYLKDGRFEIKLDASEYAAFDRLASSETRANAHRPALEGTFAAGTGEITTIAQLIKRAVHRWIGKEWD